MTNENMHIAVCLDKNFVEPSGIMMTSVCENNREGRIHFHIISADLTEEGREDLCGIVRKYDADIRFYTIDDKLTSNLPVGKEWQSFNMQSIASYYRLFLPSIITDTDKVIYLDGDIIVTGSLCKLWETDMEGYGIAAVPDVLYCRGYQTSRLGYPQEFKYCNAGVLVMNLKYWKEHNLEKTCIDFAANNPKKIVYHDQDVLNWVFGNHKIHLELKYNLQQDFLYQDKYLKMAGNLHDELDEARNRPVIIHYIYGVKPWHKECLHPYRGEFLKYKKMSKWADRKLQRYFDGSCRKKDLVHRFLYWLKNSLPGRWVIKTPDLPV